MKGEHLTDQLCTPPRPSPDAFAVHKLGRIHTMRIEYRMTGTDTADTWLFLNDVEFQRSVLTLLEYSADHASLARLKDSERKKVKDWQEFETQNAAELAQYRHLHKKFGDAA